MKAQGLGMNTQGLDMNTQGLDMKTQGLDMKAQNIRHPDLIPFEKFLHWAYAKCWSPIWHEINYILVYNKIVLIIKSETVSLTYDIDVPFGDSCVFL